MTDRCVFCSQAIGPDEERTGRGSTSAHAACADRALADDAHWDAIAEASPPEERSSSAPRAGGCLTLVAVVLTVALVIGAASGFAPF